MDTTQVQLARLFTRVEMTQRQLYHWSLPQHGQPLTKLGNIYGKHITQPAGSSTGLCVSFPGASVALYLFQMGWLVSALVWESSLKFGFLGDWDSPLIVYSVGEGPSESGQLKRLEAIWSCLPSYLRSFLKGGMFSSLRKLLHNILSLYCLSRQLLLGRRLPSDFI